ncbi:MAG TPA: sigma-70 family RNA polymerase sigma factor [Myxococcaceae bacterium]|nr:sigma-70 family RNA polymerase sigma factor [Myxococcaceae bacterium]
MSADGAEGLGYTMSDARKLLEGSRRAHNDNAYDEAFSAFYGRIVAVLVRLLDSRARAEDVASEVFWKAYRDSMDCTDVRFGGWLYRTATNLGIQDLRARVRRERYEQAAGEQAHRTAGSGTPLDDVLRAEQRARVRAVLASLRQWQARILILRSSGLTYAELAEALQIKASSVGTMLIRAEAQFQKQYVRFSGREE